MNIYVTHSALKEKNGNMNLKNTVHNSKKTRKGITKALTKNPF